jgi:DNA-binding IclR family transcriptional regulator
MKTAIIRTQRAATGTQAVERAFAVLSRVAALNATGATLAELARDLSLNRTTAYRLAKCLVAEGAIRQDSTSGRYFLGSLVLELAMSTKRDLVIRDFFAPVLTRIAEATADTAFLMVRSGNDAVCMDLRLGSYPVKAIVVDVGTRRPLGIGAGSLAIVSRLSETEFDQVMQSNADRLTKYGASPEDLVSTVRMGRKMGYASSRVLGVSNVTAVGVPILDAEGEPIAALSVTAIDERMTKARQRELVTTIREEVRRVRSAFLDAWSNNGK